MHSAIETTVRFARAGLTEFRGARVIRIAAGLAAATALSAPALAATLPSGFAETKVGTANNGTAMQFSPDGKLYVLEQAGTMKVFSGSGVSWTQIAPGGNFFTGSTLPITSAGERGLLGIAFDPDYTNNRYLYCYYTATTPAVHNRISRFTANTDGSQVVAGSEVTLMDLENLSSATNHNGGAIHFGTDGKLYVAVGENANGANAQSLANRLGKMLRLNPNPANPIPSDNPTSFPNIAGSTTGNNRAIWAVGLRNPYTFAIQPGTGRIYINDVGEGAWEEVNMGIAGANYGWRIAEGLNPPGLAGMTYPFIGYHHSDTTLTFPTPGYTGNVICGGTFYNGASYTFPADYVGDYFFGDAGGNWIRRYDHATNTVTSFATGTGSAVDFKTGPDGALYYLSRSNAGVFRIRYATTLAPYFITQPATTLNINECGTATFSVVAGGASTLAYQWQKNTVDIPGANGPSYTVSSASPDDDGAAYRVIVSNGNAPDAISNVGTLTVQPIASISEQPEAATTCQGGSAEFSVSATGVGPLSYQWQILAAPNTWTALSEQPVALACGGTASATSPTDPTTNISLVACPGVDQYEVRCVVTNGCAEVISDPASLALCRADFNCDSVVEDADFAIFASAYSTLDCADPAMPAGCPSDLNGDGMVDDADFVVFVVAYNTLVCP